MKTKNIFSIFFLLTLFSLMMISCDDTNEKTNNVNNSNNANNTNNTNNSNNLILDFSSSTCKAGGKKSIDDFSMSGFECIYYNYDGSSNLQMVHVNAIYNCCPDETLGMTGDASLSGNQFTLTGSDNGGMCNCVCPYDLVYDLQNVAPGNYTVMASPLNGPVALDLNAAVEGVFCEDNLLDYTHCEGPGERGSFCEDSTSCMQGDGYCLDINTNSVCVDGCTTSEDCPMPDLEACTADASGVNFCSPLTDFAQ